MHAARRDAEQHAGACGIDIYIDDSMESIDTGGECIHVGDIDIECLYTGGREFDYGAYDSDNHGT